MPVISGIVMPAGLLGLVAMPFGLDAPLWRIMEGGIVWMIAVAQWVAALPGSVWRLPSFGIGPLILASLGLIVLALLRTRLRWVGLVVLSVAAVMALSPERPDILVAADAQTVAVRGKDGVLRIVSAGKDAFLVRDWLTAEADRRAADDASLQQGVSCDAQGCVAALPDGRLVALSLSPQSLADDCQQAAIVVTRSQPPSGCAATVIAADDLRRSGALAIRLNGSDFAMIPVRGGGARPWSVPQPAAGVRLRRGGDATIDATPPGLGPDD
jgi:competence protein ComEC